MTREEAIRGLNVIWNRYKAEYEVEREPLDAYLMAIEALSQPIVAKHFDIQSGYIYCSPQNAENVKVVVRCKDCKHKVTTKDGEYNPEDIVCDYWATDGLEETDYCSYGERKGGGDE